MAELDDSSPMPLGKHRGKAMEDVPDNYLMWLWEQNVQKYQKGNLTHAPTHQIMRYIEDNLDAIRSNLNQ